MKEELPEEKGNYTYLLRCADGSLYCGWTNDPERRLSAHNAGRGGKYTRARRPVSLVWLERFPTKEEAMRREYRVKRMSRTAKLRLIGEDAGAAGTRKEDGNR